MADDSWTHQVRFWRAELHRRAVIGMTQRLSLRSRALVLRTIEERDYPLSINPHLPNPFLTDCLVSRHDGFPPMSVLVPADGEPRGEVEHRWGPLEVYALRNVIVDPGTGLVFHAGRVLTESSIGWRPARESAFLSGATARIRCIPAVRAARGPLVPLGNPNNYYHFVTDTIPRLLQVLTVRPDAVGVLGTPVPAFAMDVLAELGLRYVEDSEARPFASDDLWLCDLPPADWPHPGLMTVLRNAVDAAIEPILGEYPARVYLSRANSDRALLDEPLLEQELVRQGFTVLRLEDLPFREQVRHLRAANVVVGPHGAGLTNIAFMNPGGRVVEVTTGTWWQPCYRNLAAVQDLRHRLVVLPSTPDAPHGRAVDATTPVLAALTEP
jgi:hypothetical protein